MRNIFDQYSQPENKLTHALVSCLNEDDHLLNDFMKVFVSLEPTKKSKLIVSEQGLPDGNSYSEFESETRGLPDALIYPTDGDWIVVIENKISCELTLDQLDRHYKTIKKYSFNKIYGLTITTKKYNLENSDWKHCYWTDIYSWAQKHKSKSKWACCLVEYMEVLEMQLADNEYLKEGTLTTFTGVPFVPNHPYNYPEAKRILNLLISNLKQHTELERELNLNLQHPGRNAISSGRSVWDYIPVKSIDPNLRFNQLIHFSISIGEEMMYCGMVLPDKLGSVERKKIKNLGYDSFKEVIKTVAKKVDENFNELDGCIPFLQLVQRRWYKSMKSPCIDDAKLEFDLRTAYDDLHGNDNQAIKTQEEWLKACYSAFCDKESNIQISLGVKFLYDRCSQINTSEAEGLCIKAWLACQDFSSKILGYDN